MLSMTLCVVQTSPSANIFSLAIRIFERSARTWLGYLLSFALIKQLSFCVCTGVYGDSWTGLEACSAVEELINEFPSCKPADNLVVSPRMNGSSFEGENLELNLDQSVSVKSNQVQPNDDTENTVPGFPDLNVADLNVANRDRRVTISSIEAIKIALATVMAIDKNKIWVCMCFVL